MLPNTLYVLSTFCHLISFLVNISSALEPYFGSRTHRWHDANILEFETRTTVGFPRTMSIRLTSISLDETSPDQIPITDEKGILHYSAEVGCTWVDITKLWDNCSPTGGSSSKIYHAKIWSYDSQDRFDEQGSMSEECEFVPEVRRYLMP